MSSLVCNLVKYEVPMYTNIVEYVQMLRFY